MYVNEACKHLDYKLHLLLRSRHVTCTVDTDSEIATMVLPKKTNIRGNLNKIFYEARNC